MSENKIYNFSVKIILDNKGSAIFSYYQGGKEVSGGGTVNERNSLGIYTLDKETLDEGFLFTGAKFSNKEGNCKNDFSYIINDGGKSISIYDTDENEGIVCMIFIAEKAGTNYESTDPQVKNDKEL
ncbi:MULTISPECIES: DP-EP family protein [unclassified Pseudoalteromonas]|uniref:DP-EP family protein n=1 Tax=unclassified Pseudoalteromonas TaxID=194690 RepID=UPI001F3E6FB6|nr:DP-EP family protein [Pseudoalteromonas sp. L1]WOC27293.1 DP-EP family protein [Pseudoalteromonas sp. N1230-9]